MRHIVDTVNKLLLIVFILLAVSAPVQAQASEKRICADDYGRLWNTAVRQAVAQFNRVTPTVLTTTDCDIVVVVTDILPCGSGYTGCTYGGYPLRVYMHSGYAQRLSNLLHELMHAFGFWQHEETVASVTNQGFYSYRRLTEFDIQTLRGMYP